MTELEAVSRDTDEIAAIWADRLTTAITDWTNTIDWTTPDFNPASATTELLKRSRKNLCGKPNLQTWLIHSLLTPAFLARDLRRK